MRRLFTYGYGTDSTTWFYSLAYLFRENRKVYMDSELKQRKPVYQNFQKSNLWGLYGPWAETSLFNPSTFPTALMKFTKIKIRFSKPCRPISNAQKVIYVADLHNFWLKQVGTSSLGNLF